MEAPDKKYPLSVIADLLASRPPNEVVFMPDKIYFDGVDTSTIPRLAINVEYIRKDALLEWAKEVHDSGPIKDSADKGDAWSIGYLCGMRDIIDKLNSL